MDSHSDPSASPSGLEAADASQKRLAWQELCPNWPEDIAERYRSAGLWRDETFFSFLSELAERYGAETALIDPQGELSFNDLRASADDLARGLTQAGLAPGDRVILQLPNGLAFVELFFALMRIGVVPVLALPAHRDREIGEFAAFSGARALFVPQMSGGDDLVAMGHRIRASCPSLETIVVCDPDAPSAEHQIPLKSLRGTPLGPLPDGPTSEDVACFQISGGTTGVPKLIPRRHMEYLYNIRCAAAASGFSRATRYLCALPISHNFPLACPGILGALSAGGRAVLAPDPSPETCFALIADHAVTVTSLVPPLALLWMEARRSDTAPLPSLTLLQVGGAKLNPSSARQIGPALGCQLQQVFGMAEGLVCFTALDDSDTQIATTQGRPMSPFDEVRIVGPDGKEVATGARGALQVRGPYTIRGYFNLPEKNAEAITADGFYCSGDIVSRDSTGALTVEGRDKDQVNRGGEKIGVDEIEDLLIGLPGVADAAVVGQPDPRLGERLCAFIRPDPDNPPAPRRLRRELAGLGLASYKMPDDIRVLETFPQTGVGKVNKRQLRLLLRAQYFETGPTTSGREDA